MSHPVVALWSHPRSMSTAFERVMRARGDMECLHEPFMFDYYINRSKRTMPLFNADEDHPRTYDAIRDMIMEKAEHGPVFFKDMSYYVVPRIFDDPAFIDRVTHSFLVRDLKASMVSYARLDPDFTCEEIGLEAQWLHVSFLMARSGKTPVIVRSENVRQNPRRQMQVYWQAVGLADRPEALNWDDAAPEDWQQVSGWHRNVMSSKAIQPISSDEKKAAQASFDALLSERPHLQAFYGHQAVYHAKLLDLALG